MGHGETDADSLTPAWVIEQLLELGFSPGDAVRLAEGGADYRRVADALEAGCSHALAVEIFL